jgi:hypothetical protein
MSAQGHDFRQRRLALASDKETERLERQSKRDEEGNFQVRALLASVMPNTSGRIIDWNSFRR